MCKLSLLCYNFSKWFICIQLTIRNIYYSSGISKDILESNIPKKYEIIPDFIWLDIIRSVIKPLEKEEKF